MFSCDMLHFENWSVKISHSSSSDPLASLQLVLCAPLYLVPNFDGLQGGE
jgi:hypothetical protein